MMPSPMNPTASSAMPTTSRRLDPQSLAGAQATGRLARDRLAVDEVAPRLRRLAALRPGGRMSAALPYERVMHLGQRLQLAYHAVAALVLACAARASPQRVRGDPQRELQLQRLHRRVQRVRHRDMHAARPVRVLARALAAAQRLVVGEVVVA